MHDGVTLAVRGAAPVPAPAATAARVARPGDARWHGSGRLSAQADGYVSEAVCGQRAAAAHRGRGSRITPRRQARTGAPCRARPVLDDGQRQRDVALDEFVLGDGPVGSVPLRDGIAHGDHRTARVIGILGPVETVRTPEGSGLLTGDTSVEITIGDGTELGAALALSPGFPEFPCTEKEFATKFADCGAGVPGLLVGLDRKGAAHLMRDTVPLHRPKDHA